MEDIRKPFQGVWNVIRFNWHFYAGAALLAFCFLILNRVLAERYRVITDFICLLITFPIGVSLIVSFYVYDASGLYSLNWIPKGANAKGSLVVNIHAGFDETSVLLKSKIPESQLVIYDFYDPLEHTEVSIKRAREAYPTFAGTKRIKTSFIPLEDGTADDVFLIFSAHEIRDKDERKMFFLEIRRILKPSGNVYLTEHIRDFPNFMAYNIGFLHFMSKRSWYKTFSDTNLNVIQKIKITPFVTVFTLTKNGIPS